MTKNRITIWRMPEEFEVIDTKIKELGKSDLNCFLRGEIRKLEKTFRNCPLCITHAKGGDKIQKFHYIEQSSYEALSTISDLMDKPISSIIDDFIISPLLRPNTYGATGNGS